ncbi:Zinc finger protein 141 [Dissostichus eleginoides]|uniref:Zinc finger protein 141 n=1 Tax=Dissostichus eleginoides TaxID=100907 RepID=A0AAD9ETX6_DISEL|nr:Zinc finger protein 141 [Dissostichus eleginoides]
MDRRTRQSARDSEAVLQKEECAQVSLGNIIRCPGSSVVVDAVSLQSARKDQHPAEKHDILASTPDVQVDQDNAKVGLFVAAAVGTLALMAAVYCIYNKFYSKHQYLHTQLNDDSDFSTDPMDPPPVCFHASAGSSAVDVQRAGYGSLSDTPSIISVPPSLSPPPSAMPFPPLFLSSHSLRTISAKDLEKSCA